MFANTTITLAEHVGVNIADHTRVKCIGSRRAGPGLNGCGGKGESILW